jgi:DnaJ-class molecular chaperone
METRELRVVVPPGTTDGHEVVFDGEGDYDERTSSYGSVVVAVSVAKKEGQWTRCGSNLHTTQAVSLSDAQRLRMDLVLPWGTTLRVDESALGGPAGPAGLTGSAELTAPLVGTFKIEAEGIGAGDVYVSLKLEMPATWGTVPDLSPYVASLVPAPSAASAAGAPSAQSTESGGSEAALAHVVLVRATEAESFLF